MKKYLILCFVLLFLTGCNQQNATTQSTTELTTQEITTENELKNYIQESEGQYLIFGKNDENILYQDVVIFDEKTNKEYITKQISENFYLQFYEDQDGKVKKEYIESTVHLAMALRDEYFEVYGTQYSETEIENIAIYRLFTFQDGTKKYIQVDSHLDENKSFLIFYPKYNGQYIIALKPTSAGTSSTTTPIYPENEFEFYQNQITKEAYCLCVMGPASVNVYDNEKLITTYKTTNAQTVNEIKENELYCLIGDYNDDGSILTNSLTIQTNKNKNYVFEVVPHGSCEVMTLTVNYTNTQTQNDDITTWNLNARDDNSIMLMTSETIINDKKYTTGID